MATAERGSKTGRITDLEKVKKLFRRPPPEERGSIRYVGTDEDFEKIQKMIAESGAILEGHFDLGSPEGTDDSSA